MGAMVKEVDVDNGAITLTYGNNASKALDGQEAHHPPGGGEGRARGADRVDLPQRRGARQAWRSAAPTCTDIEQKYLPIECRGAEAK